MNGGDEKLGECGRARGTALEFRIVMEAFRSLQCGR
jgi:hypothetical protein